MGFIAQQRHACTLYSRKAETSSAAGAIYSTHATSSLAALPWALFASSKIAYDTAGAIGAKVDLASAKDEFVAQFARLSFAILQGLCVEATSGCLEHVVKAWKNIVASCAQSGVGYGILSQLVSPHMIEKQWYTLGCASQTQVFPVALFQLPLWSI